MKKLYFTTFCLLVVVHVFAQNQRPQLIEVRGDASMQVPPDLAVISIHFSSHEMAFNKAVKSVNQKNASLLKQLEKLGFNRKEIKSNGFNAGKNSFYKNNELVDSGYIASQSIILEFKYDQQRLTQLVDAFTETTLDLISNSTSSCQMKKRRKSAVNLLNSVSKMRTNEPPSSPDNPI